MKLGVLCLAALSLTAGCGALPLGPNGTTAAGGVRTYRQSWMAPDAGATREVLFESDRGYESVEMFSLPDFKLKGVITGFAAPGGMCSDTSGDVYVVNHWYPGFATIELSHTGKLLRTISDYYAWPAGCAVNPTNGDLAVGNIEGESQVGMVSLFPKGASGYDRWLKCTAISAYFFVGYDPHGNLFVDGQDNQSGGFHLCRGRDANETLTEVKVSGAKINWPGMVQWYEHGKYLAVGDQHCGGSNVSCIYKVAISGDTGKVIGSTKPLNPDGSPLCDLVQGAIAPGGAMLLFGGDDTSSCGNQPPSVDEWPFPAGGVPSKHYANIRFINEPAGAALSIKP